MAKITKEQRRSILEDTISKIKGKMPDNTVGFYNQIGADVDIETISTGSIAVDAVIGGGFPKGKIVDIVGHTSSGKTTLATTACATMQKENPEEVVAYLDVEQTFDPRYAEALGVDLDRLILSQPGSGEETFETAEMLISSGLIKLLVIDSIAAMIPRAMIERDFTKEVQPGTSAKMIAQGLPKLVRLASQQKCTVILINQWKPAVKLNQYAPAPAGSIGNWYQPGGSYLPFACTQIIEIKRVSQLLEGKEIISNVIQMDCKKNKIAPPHTKAQFVITFGKGLDKAQELIGLGIEYGVIRVAGSFFSFPDYAGEIQSEISKNGKTVQGRSNLGKAIEDDAPLMEWLEATIKDKIREKHTIKFSGDDISEDIVDDKGGNYDFNGEDPEALQNGYVEGTESQNVDPLAANDPEEIETIE